MTTKCFGRKLYAFFIVSVITTLTIGCATSGDKKTASQKVHEALSEVSNVLLPGDAGGPSMSNAHLDEALRDVIGACVDVLNALEARGDARRKRLIVTAVIGSIAGSVAAPAVLASEGSVALATGFSGLSGVTNTLQQLLSDDGGTRTDILLARDGVVREMNAIVSQWMVLEGINSNQDSAPAGRAKLNAKKGLLGALVMTCSTYSLAPAELSKELEDLIDATATDAKISEKAQPNP